MQKEKFEFKKEKILTNDQEIHDFLKSNPRISFEATIDDKEANPEVKQRILVNSGGEYVDGRFHCVFTVIDPKPENITPYDGLMATAAFKEIKILE